MRSVFRPARHTALATALALALMTQAAGAQDQVWIQIEARPSLAEANARAEAYATAFPETRGFRLPSGWYGIALGPYGAEEGAAALAAMKRQNLIPNDSYITDGREFRGSFWEPEGGAAAAVSESLMDDPAAALAEALEGGAVETPPGVPPVSATPLPDVAAADPAPEPAPEPEPAFIDESPAEARASESAMTPDEKKLLQTALAWFGHYDGAIDGAYGPGTRNSMAGWQTALGLEPTGVLTSHQRATLIANYQADMAEFGYAPIEEQEAGINVTLPLALVEFDRYAPPFVHYRAKDGSDLSIVLISQPGDAGAFAGLYDILQSLDAMPQTGERDFSDSAFRIHGTDATRNSHAWARHENGFIKGWMLLSTPAHADRDARIMEVIEQSFRQVGETALDPGLVPLDDAARRGLVAGLEVKRPTASASGFYVAPNGTVLTAAATVAQCGKITLDTLTEATVTATDAASGLALLTPATPLSPPAVAALPASPPPVGAEVVVAGYSYGDRLPAPVLTWGVLEDLTGLDGQTGVNRLAIPVLAGDIGGPVIAADGAVIGLLSPAPADGARQLPQGTFHAADAATITAFLAAQGVTAIPAAAGAPLPPETLTRQASGMTVLVSCWK